MINLRFQTLSFPSSAFKTSTFFECFRYWHSPAFSDTETTLYLCAYGEFRYVLSETMKYRENSSSESHVVNSLEASISASISLSRVFTSREFELILQMVEPSEQGRFFSELISSIEMRIPNSPLAHFVKILATEECCRVWKYEESQATSALASSYLEIGSEFTSKLLYRIAGGETLETSSDLQEALSELNLVKSVNLTSATSRPRSFLWSLSSHFPLKFRIKLFRIYTRLYAIKQPNHYWNAYWK